MKDGGHRAMHAVELLDGARGWKIAVASFAPVRSAASGTPPAATMPAPTPAGPLAALLAAPTKVSTDLLDDGEDGPLVFVVGPELADRAIGLVDAGLLAYKLGKQGITRAPTEPVHEVRTGTWGYAVANLGPKRMTGLVIALPGTSSTWRIVAAAYNAVAEASTGDEDAAHYTSVEFLADPLCPKVAAKIVECVETAEFVAALDDGATKKQKQLNARLRKAVANWQEPGELCRNTWSLINYEYSGFLDHPVAFKAADALGSCASLGAAVKAAGGLVGGKTFDSDPRLAAGYTERQYSTLNRDPAVCSLRDDRRRGVREDRDRPGAGCGAGDRPR